MTFAEVDDLVYNQLKIPQYNLDLVSIHTVSVRPLRQLNHRIGATQYLSLLTVTGGAALSERRNKPLWGTSSPNKVLGSLLIRHATTACMQWRPKKGGWQS